MKTSFFIFILAIILNSCTKKQETRTTLDCDVVVTVHDKLGNDLLNPSTPNAYTGKNIKLFYLINGAKKEQDFAGNCIIYDLDGKYQIRLGLNAVDSISTTIIQWSENDTDTLIGEIYKNEGLILCKKLWYKDNLVFTTDDYSKERSLSLIK